MKISNSLVTLGLLAGWLGFATPVQAQGTVYVVHGIPGEDIGAPTDLPVDVTVNGACAIEGFVFGDIIGPLPFDAGLYDIEVALANAETPCANDPVISASGIEVEDGQNYSIVAHLDEAGGPTASVFVNNLDASRYSSRVNVAHVAAAPRVDIKLKRSYAWWSRGNKIRDVGNGEQADVRVRRGQYDVTIAPAGSRHPVFGPIPVLLERNTAYGVYAVGSLATGSFTLLVTTLEDATPPPASAFVVHGIPGVDLGLDPALPVDVSVNGECALPGFTFGEIVGPLELPEGTYDLAIGLANAETPCSEDPVIAADGVALAGGESYSIVAHLTEGGMPTASVFENDLYAGRYIAGLNVFHTAAAPRVDVKLQRTNKKHWKRSIRDIGNGEAADTLLWRGSWDASISPAGTKTPVLGPVTLDLQDRTVYLVYAVGSLTNSSFTLLVAATDAKEY